MKGTHGVSVRVGVPVSVGVGVEVDVLVSVIVGVGVHVSGVAPTCRSATTQGVTVGSVGLGVEVSV